MRTGLKLLTVGLVLVTAAVAGCSSTAAGPAGAIQDDATLPPSPASSSASAGHTSSTAPVVSPTAAPTEAPASPVASPTASPSPSGSSAGPALLGSMVSNNDVCDSGLPYSCGDIGASGVGTVFYANSTAFACGPNMTSSCNYLESAPNLWAPDSQSSCSTIGNMQGPCGGSVQNTSDWAFSGKGISWCTASNKNMVISGAQATVIGSGLSNTLAIAPMCGLGSAALAAQGYEGGGLSDWSLPSQEELDALYYYPNRAAIGGFTKGYYWSSSESNKKPVAVNFPPKGLEVNNI